LGVSVVTTSALGMAQQRRQNDVRQFYLNKDSSPAVSAANNARARARSGDCKGALDPFDVAITYWQEPTLRRDRGLCHEQLGHPYPAIEDYRAYLAAAPQAPDYEQIKQRLEHLESSYGEATASDTPTEPQTAAAASGNVSISTDSGVSSSGSTSGDKDKRGVHSSRWTDERTAYNAFYAEILGAGGIYSLNYDRLFSEHVGMRLGMSYVYYGASASVGDTTLGGSSHLFTFPLDVNFFVGPGDHKLELGGGATLLYATATVAGGSAAISGAASGQGFTAMGNAVIGYRYAPQDGGFMFRVGFTPLIGGSPVRFYAWAGVSAGYQF
jgi:hypothetical protein